MGLMLELLSRTGKVQKFIRLKGKSFTVGRGYENDIVLDDPYVSPHHLNMILNDDGVLLEDKNSLNGIKDNRNKRFDLNEPLAIGQVFVVGSQAMRVMSTTKNVIQTIKMTTIEYFAHSINRWYWAVASISLLFGTLLFRKYLMAYNSITWSKLLISPLKPVLFIIAISVFIAFLASLLKKESKFFTSLVVGVWLFIFILLNEGLQGVIGFNGGENTLYVLFHYVTRFLQVGMAIWFFFYFSTHLNVKKITLVATALTVIFMAYLYAKNDRADKVITYPVQKTHILPKSLLFVSSEPHESWVKGTSTLFDSATNEAAELNRKAK